MFQVEAHLEGCQVIGLQFGFLDGCVSKFNTDILTQAAAGAGIALQVAVFIVGEFGNMVLFAIYPVFPGSNPVILIIGNQIFDCALGFGLFFNSLK